MHLREPWAINATTTVIRRQYQSINPHAGTNQFTLGLGRMTDAQRAIHTRGVRLSDRAVLLKFAPEQTFVATNCVPMIGWINSYLPDRYRGLTVVYAAPRK